MSIHGNSSSPGPAADGADPDVRILSDLVVSACASSAKAAKLEKVTN
jgi:hypothetical protein